MASEAIELPEFEESEESFDIARQRWGAGIKAAEEGCDNASSTASPVECAGITAMWALGQRERQLLKALSLIAELRAEKEFRKDHDEAARISCTTLDPLAKPFDEMSDEELRDAFEYSDTCGCTFCFQNGYIFRLRAEKAKAELALSSSRQAVLTEALEAVRGVRISPSFPRAAGGGESACDRCNDQHPRGVRAS